MISFENKIREGSAHLKHYLNPLHIYCRARDVGLSKVSSSFLCRLYEKGIFKPFISDNGNGRKVSQLLKTLTSFSFNAKN